MVDNNETMGGVGTAKWKLAVVRLVMLCPGS